MISRNMKNSTLFGLLVLGWTLLVSPGTEAQTLRREILAIVTHVAGDVSAKPPGGPRLAVRDFLAVRDGTSFELKPGATLTLVCTSGAVMKLEESGPLGVEQCREAARANRTLTEAAGCLASRGRVTLWQNSPVLEGETRALEGFQGIRPQLLSPRCPNEMSPFLECSRLVEAPREIRWAEVEGVSDYEVVLDGFDLLEVEAAECTEDPRLEHPVCSRAWPESWRVEAGEKYFLQVKARLDLFEEVESEKTKIELLGSGEAAEVRAEVEAIEALGLDPQTRGLLLASLYAERRLFNRAVETLEEVTLEASDPLFHLALGDAYLKVGLLHPALLRYGEVLKRLETTGERREIRAAAEFGLGWTHFLDDRRQLALEHFRKSEELSADSPLTSQTARMIEKLRRLE